MPPNDAIHFGTAYIDVKASLAEYDRQMQAIEQRRHETLIKLRTEAGGDGGGDLEQMLFGPVDLESRLHVLGGAMTANTSKGRMLLNVIGSIARGLTRVLWPVALVVEGGNILKMLEEMPNHAERLYEKIKQLTFRGVVREVHDFASAIPVIGHLWSGVAETVSRASAAMGFENFTRSIRESEAAAARAENRLRGLARAAQIVRDTGVADSGQAYLRNAELAPLTDPQRIRREDYFNRQDLARQARDAAGELTAKFQEAMASLQSERDAGEITDAEMRTQAAIASRQLRQQLAGLDMELNQSLKAAAAAATARLGQYALQRSDEIESLQRQLAIVRVGLEGSGMSAQAESIRIGYEHHILKAERDGDRQRADLLRQLTAARIQSIKQHEQQAAEARVQSIQQHAQEIEDAIRDTQRRIRRAEIEMSMPPGPERDKALREFDIDSSGITSKTRLQRELEAMQARQNEILGKKYNTTADDIIELKALGDKIAQHQQLIALIERETKAQKDLARQQALERSPMGGGMQISGRDAIGYFKNQPQTSSIVPRTTNTGQRQLEMIEKHAEAIRRALDNRTIGAVLN